MRNFLRTLMCGIVIFVFFHQSLIAQFPKLIPYRKADKWGFADNKKKIIIEPIYDSVAPFMEGLAAVMKTKKWGFINETGKEVIPLKYDRVQNFRPNKLAVVIMAKYAGNVWGLVDSDGKVIVEPKYSVILGMNHGFLKVKLGLWFGLINETGVEVVKPVYKTIYEFSEGMAKVESAGKTWGFIDSTGKEVVQPKTGYEEAMDFSNGLGVIKEKDYYGVSYFFVDKQGQIAHNKQKYTDVTTYVNGLSRVTVKERNTYKTSIVDIAGKPVFSIEPEFGYAHILPNAIVITKAIYPPGYKMTNDYFEDYKNMKLKYGVSDKSGTILKEAQYDAVELLDGDIIALQKEGKWLVYNSRKNIVLGQGYEQVRTSWINKFIEVKVNSKWGCIDTNGKIRFAPKYDSVGLSTPDYTIVGNAGKFSVTDATGKEMFPLKYQMTFDMENGVGFFAMNDKAGIVDKKGKEIVPAKYYQRKVKISSSMPEMLSGYSFKDGIALVIFNGRGGYVDKTGKEYWEE